MNRQFKRFPARRARRGRRRQRNPNGRQGLQSTGAPYSYSVRTGPVRAPPIPAEFSVSLSDYWDANVVAATDQTATTVGLLEFFNKRPIYSAELYAIYKYARVTAAEIEIELVSTSNNQVQIALGHVPYEDVAGLTISRLVQVPGSIRRTVSLSGGMDKVILRKFWNVQQLIGNPAFDKTYWIDASQSTSGTPVDAKEPVIVMIVDNLVGGTTAYSCTLNWKVTYHIQFFSLEVAGES
jgi:hypothetical protein